MNVGLDMVTSYIRFMVIYKYLDDSYCELTYYIYEAAYIRPNNELNGNLNFRIN